MYMHAVRVVARIARDTTELAVVGMDTFKTHDARSAPTLSFCCIVSFASLLCLAL